MSYATFIQTGIELASYVLTIIFVGFTLGRVVRRVAERFLYEAEINRIVRFNLAALVARVGEWLVYAATLFVIAEAFHVTFWAAVFLGSLTVGLLSINLVLEIAFSLPNVYVGIVRRELRQQSNITHRGVRGRVVSAHWRHLLIDTKTGDRLILPYVFLRTYMPSSRLTTLRS